MKKRFLSLFLFFSVFLTAFSGTCFAAAVDSYIVEPYGYYFLKGSNWICPVYRNYSESLTNALGYFDVSNKSFTDNPSGFICPIKGFDNVSSNGSSGFHLFSPVVSANGFSFSVACYDENNNRIILANIKDIISLKSGEQITGICPYFTNSDTYPDVGDLVLQLDYRVSNSKGEIFFRHAYTYGVSFKGDFNTATIYQQFDCEVLNPNGSIFLSLLGTVPPNSGRTANRSKFDMVIFPSSPNPLERIVWGSGKRISFDLLIPDSGRVNNYILNIPPSILKNMNKGRLYYIDIECSADKSISDYYYGGLSKGVSFVYGAKLNDNVETYKNPYIAPTSDNANTTVKIDNSDTAITFPTTNIKTGDIVQVVDNSTGDLVAHYQYDSTSNTWNQVSNITNIYYNTTPVKPPDPPYITNPNPPPTPPDSGGGGGSSSTPTTPDGGGGGSSGTDWLGKLLKSLLDGFLKLLNSVVGGVVDVIVGLVTKLVDGITTIINSLFNILKQFLTFDSEFGKFFGSFFGWLPPEIIVLITGGISIMIALAIIKFLRNCNILLSPLQ